MSNPECLLERFADRGAIRLRAREPEYEDLLARSKFSDFAKDVASTVETIAPIALDFLKRGEEHLAGRSELSDFASGFEKGFIGTLKTLAPIALSFLKREDLELLARSYP